MSQFYIAMGQGVVAPADVEIFTEALYSCTFIAGRSGSSSRGGAFHYPAESLREVRAELAQWMEALRPVEIVLVFAAEVSTGMGTTARDQTRLVSWFREHFPRVALTSTTATAACTTLIGGAFYAGPTGEQAYWDPDTGTDLVRLEPGPYAEYHLFDARPRLTASSPAIVQEESGGRRKRKRSFMKRCIVM